MPREAKVVPETVATIMEAPDRLRLRVRVQPRAGRSRIMGSHGGLLKVQVAAPPVGGAANAALVDLVADQLGVRRADVTVIAGQRGKTKILDVVSGNPAVLYDRLCRIMCHSQVG